MINTDEFVKRLETVFEYYGLTASSFADKINIQRSSVSHLLSGRNKPSLDFILKVIENFPEIELQWIINGNGNFPAMEDQIIPSTKVNNIFVENISNNNNLQNDNNNLFNTSPIEIENENIFSEKKIIATTENEKSISNTLHNNSEIDRIVIFYKDGTFSSFNEKE